MTDTSVNGVSGPAKPVKPAKPDDSAARKAMWRALAAAVPSDWYATAPPKRTWLLRDLRHPKTRGVLPLGKVGQLIAEGGAGKTMALVQLAVAVATGGAPWLGAFSVPEPGRVLLVLGEEDAEESRRRLYQATRASHTTAPAEGAIVVLPLAAHYTPMLLRDEDGNLVETAFLTWLRDYVHAGDFRLVVIDPLSRFAGTEAETDNASATRFIQALESLVTPRCTLLNAHHTNKLSRGKDSKVDATSGRGSSAFVDGARWQCALSVEYLKLEGAEEQARFGEIVTFDVTKSNYAAKPSPVSLRRDHDNGGALVPVADDDMASIQRARNASTDRATRNATKRKESETRHAEKAERDERERQEKTARQEDKAKTRRDEEVSALRTIVTGQPGIAEKDILAALRAVLGSCSDGAGKACIARARLAGWLDVKAGSKNAKQHFVKDPS